ncbi:4-hydroxythreonine-4-phosphate dehydrogenase PdxA [Methylophaga sp. OBS4]|uniref:4-hydroxythreonine-4-phosphate dehydrogenase PdxA n=1 Tax=Methylophaga sp. OBS4 TaxID=2991935 RepID=UPI002253D6A4|nr:4-hydroxythreonine-4-phosphate dehydrogenase PdxA [Methylophaga sp. OBS4]MCX4188560.1 4-hydroxythreonine-4-phosphate dehydrogenase PdxA [Methylophaga sp. OBS4]
MSSVRRVALTAGEPAGIGPDICIQLAQDQQQAQLIAIADPYLLSERAEALGLKINLIKADLSQPAITAPAGSLYYCPVPLRQPSIAGQLNVANACYVLDTLQLALEGCQNKRFDAVVTAPVHKGVINDAGFTFSGHTEFFAEGAGVDKVVMMLAADSLRVALATTHLPLKEVSEAISQNSLKQVIQIIHQSMQRQFGLAAPRIAVCGLNPHAGEGGHLGREEIEVITPVIEQLSAQGIRLSGPWPADTIFNQDKLQHFDVILAMYHDQGLPVLKHHGFGKAVNITLGLPFIRTSVDHGTALDLAGTGKASATSLQAAVDMAIMMANSQG